MQNKNMMITSNKMRVTDFSNNASALTKLTLKNKIKINKGCVLIVCAIIFVLRGQMCVFFLKI